MNAEKQCPDGYVDKSQCPHCALDQSAVEALTRSAGSAAVPITCEACGMTGEVESPGHMESVSCPDCNARYLYWPEGQKHGGKSPWKCVVRPIFRQPPQNDELSRAVEPS